MRILLLSAYDADSHKRWRSGLVTAFSKATWTVLTLPPRFFSWRIRGNSLTWYLTEQETLSAAYDVIIATSMVDLSSLRGFFPSLGKIPTIVYFHENQFAYPESGQQVESVEAKMVTLYNAYCADLIAFNSEYNRQTFFEGANALLRKMPDGLPNDPLACLEAKSQILPVPIEDHCFEGGRSNEGVLGSDVYSENTFAMVWNHRWEHDKGADRLLKILTRLPEDMALRIHVVGQRFRNIPPVFEELREFLAERSWLGVWGYVEDIDRYHQLLKQTPIVLSTAYHDFQGLSILEAIAFGCSPLVPNALVYPEYIPRECLYDDNSENERDILDAVKKIQNLHSDFITGKALPRVNVEKYRWSMMRQGYDDAISRVK